ncbi:sigma-70 family RNA polymerase sigma factor [Aquisphaera insulae]|uniref:sigma-70 family RNA polymerase sigma factor n=1 Tax=Aquisphaera insulae TaxID=2712864 RepID=UPI0013ED756F|nr:sigma-70 family RNA polymerase sigma factor [Aquisphaera insulae]
MVDVVSRPHRSCPDDRRGFSPRTNPNRQASKALPGAEDSAARAGAGQLQGPAADFPERCTPRRPRQPLNEDQKSLADRYFPLAVRMACEMTEKLPRHADDWQESAFVALVEAAQVFDPDRGVDFAAYARIHIRGALANTRSEIRGGKPGARPQGRVPHTFYDSDLEEDATLQFRQAEGCVGAELEFAERVERLSRGLPDHQARTLRYIYLDGMSQQEAAARIGCSEPTLSRIHQRVLTRLRQDHALNLCA